MSQNEKRLMLKKLVAWLLMSLMLEFVLGVLLTTVVNYDPTKPTGLQTNLLVAHMLVGALLFIGSLIHVFMSRDAHVLGIKPLLGFISILVAFTAGGVAAGTGSDIAVLLMALFFGAAITVYGISYPSLLSE
jgi:hypothetical protein